MVRSQRYNGRGRARTFGDRSWLGAAVAQSARACVRQVKVDRKDVGMVLRRSVPAIVHTLGRISQGLGRIGANGTMVIRMRVESKLLGGLWLVRARARRGVGKRRHNHWGLLIYSLRRSRGAMGRVWRPTGAVAAAAGVPRRPTDGSDGFPGGGKGLKP